MVRIGTCPACQFGNHREHERVVQTTPEGVMGGVVCGCKGECDSKPARHIQRQIDVIARAMRSVAPRKEQQ